MQDRSQKTEVRRQKEKFLFSPNMGLGKAVPNAPRTTHYAPRTSFSVLFPIKNPKSKIQNGIPSVFRPLRTPHSALRTGFTLVEVIVVIGIIALLTAILLPSLHRAKQMAYKAQTVAYISQLNAGALRYQQEEQYFPGQETPGIMGTGASQYTGSQVLAAAVFGLSMNGSGGFRDVVPSSPYVAFKEDRVVNINTSTGSNDDYAFAPKDLFPDGDCYPLLYYPSRLGNDGRVGTAVQNGNNSDGAFRFADNGSYTDTGSTIRNTFRSFIWDKRFGTTTDPNNTTPGTAVGDKAYNSDTFLLFGRAIENRSNASSYFTKQSPKNF